jgi:hypothetical protein
LFSRAKRRWAPSWCWASRCTTSPKGWAGWSRESERMGEPVLNAVNLGGLFVGVAIMYFTAFFVKF